MTPVMAGKKADPLHLHRIDPGRNMRRFYVCFGVQF